MPIRLQVVFSTGPSITGTGSLDIIVPSGHQTQNGAIWVQAVGGASGNVVSYTAVSNTSGYPDVTGTVTLAPSGIVITSPPGVVGQSSFTENLSVGSVQLIFSTYRTDGSGNPIVPELPVPTSIPLTINLANTNAAVGSISPASLTITAADVTAFYNASETATFTLLRSRQRIISDTAAGFGGSSVTANVTNTTPSILIGGTGQNDSVIGKGLQSLYQVTLTAPAPAAGLQISVKNTSGNVLLSPDGVIAGAATISISVAAGKSTANFYVQGVQQLGRRTPLTISVCGLQRPTSAPADVV